MQKQPSNQKPYIILGDRRKMSHEEWLKIRKFSKNPDGSYYGTIGGSEIAAVANLSRYSTALAVWADKIGIVDKSNQDNEKMLWGRILEAPIKEEFAKRTGMKVQELYHILGSRQYPFLSANLDGICFEEDPDTHEQIPCVLEIKTCSFFASEDWSNEGLPLEYFCQVQHYMNVTGMKRAYLCCLIAGQELVIRKVDRDNDVITFLTESAAAFWECLKSNTTPMVTAKDNSVIAQIYPQSKVTSINLDTSFIDKINKLEELKAKEKEIKEAKDSIEAEIKQALQDNEAATIGEYKISWKTSSRTSFSADKAKAMLTADQIASCNVTTSTRTLRISKTKPKTKK